MKFTQKLIAVVGALLPLVAGAPTPQAEAGQRLAGKYIVALREGADLEAATAFARTAHARSLARRQAGGEAPAGVERTYDGAAFLGYAGGFDEATIEEIRNNEDVTAVEQDQMWSTFALTTQADAPYGLASISSRQAGTTTYTYDDSAGEGTTAYVVDTGINAEHVEFEGRARLGYNAVDDDPVDRNGHGTHCAGTIGSRAYGVAKRASIVAVKVFSGSGGTVADVLDGYNWAVSDIVNNGRQGTSVISMSLGGGPSQVFNDAVANGVAQGITVVVAAGNSGADASGFSPASAPEAITVGAVNADRSRGSVDGFVYSNYGPLLDIFASGTDVLSTWIGSPDATNSISGTSMATPHVAGLVLYLQRLEGLTSPASIVARIQELATRDVVGDAGPGSPNLLAFNGAT